MKPNKEQTIIRITILSLVLIIFIITSVYAFLFLNKIFISTDELNPTFLKYANLLWVAVLLQASTFIFWIARKLFKVNKEYVEANKTSINKMNQIIEILDSLEVWIDDTNLKRYVQILRNLYLDN